MVPLWFPTDFRRFKVLQVQQNNPPPPAKSPALVSSLLPGEGWNIVLRELLRLLLGFLPFRFIRLFSLIFLEQKAMHFIAASVQEFYWW